MYVLTFGKLLGKPGPGCIQWLGCRLGLEVGYVDVLTNVAVRPDVVNVKPAWQFTWAFVASDKVSNRKQSKRFLMRSVS